MGKRSRARTKAGAPAGMNAPTSDYTDEQGNVLTLRGSLTLGARGEYAAALGGEGAGSAATREDAEQRAVEMLFERLAARWTLADAPIERPNDLLARLRAASPAERAWVRASLREHCAEWFPDVRVP